MRKKQKISSARLWNNSHKLRFAMYNTLFGARSNEDIGNNYPITRYIVANSIDIAIVIHSLKNLESKGNETARELLFNQFKDYDLTIDFMDLLQELRIVLLELENDGLITLENATYYDGENGENATYIDKFNIVANGGLSENEFIKMVYGCVSGYLYKNKTRIDNKHIAYEIDENTLVSLYDRKSLSQFIEMDSINSRSDLNLFRNYVISASNKQAISNRLNIIDGLISGWTYKEISTYYNIPIGTIGDNVSALKRLYKECFKCAHEFKEYKPMNFNKSALLETNDNTYIYETTKNRDLLANINYIIG